MRRSLFRGAVFLRLFSSRASARLAAAGPVAGRTPQPSPNARVVRFGSNPILHFPPSAIHALQEAPDGTTTMTVNFMGLIGPLGTLPNYITELIAGRVRVRDTALLDFLNIFNHRLISLFYKAWEKNRFHRGLRARTATTRLSHQCCFRSSGSARPDCAAARPCEDESFIYYSGLFGMLPKSAVALEAMLSRLLRYRGGSGAVCRDVAQPGRAGSMRFRRRRFPNPRCSVSARSWATRSGTSSRGCGSSWDRLTNEQYREFLPTGRILAGTAGHHAQSSAA